MCKLSDRRGLPVDATRHARTEQITTYVDKVEYRRLSARECNKSSRTACYIGYKVA